MYQVKGVNEKGQYHFHKFNNFDLARLRYEQIKKKKYKVELIMIEQGKEEILLTTEGENELPQ